MRSVSRIPGQDYDLSRRSYDFLDPAGRALFLVDAPATRATSCRAWPVVGNVPGELAERSRFDGDGQSLKISNITAEFRTTVEISLPGMGDAAELWTITVENLTDSRDRSRSFPTWNGFSIARKPTAATLSTTGSSPRSSTQAACMPCLPGTSTRRPWVSLPRTTPRRVFCPRGLISSAAPAASGRRGCSKPWHSR